MHTYVYNHTYIHTYLPDRSHFSNTKCAQLSQRIVANLPAHCVHAMCNKCHRDERSRNAAWGRILVEEKDNGDPFGAHLAPSPISNNMFTIGHCAPNPGHKISHSDVWVLRAKEFDYMLQYIQI